MRVGQLIRVLFNLSLLWLRRVSEKYKVPPKNLALVSDETLVMRSH